MKDTTEARPKALLVGKTWICQQIAYVLDLKDYAVTEKLTHQNFEQYHDCQIYVCEFKRKSRQYVKLKTKTIIQLNLQYLDDICRNIDTAYYENRKRHANDSHQTQALSAGNVTPTKAAAETVAKPSLGQRIMRGMKHPLRAAWHVVLRLKFAAKQHHVAVQKSRAQRNPQKHLRKQIRRGKLKYLCRLKPSELLLYVLRAKPNNHIYCTRLEDEFLVRQNGDILGCCSAIVPFGNLLSDGEVDEVYHSTYARIVKLSSLNHSYCLCNFNKFCKGYRSTLKKLPTKSWQTRTAPSHILLNFDHSCNLCCKSCRTQPYVLDETEQAQTSMIVDKLLRSGYLEKSQTLLVAGMGEAFYSPYYRRLLTTELQRQQIQILSNGTLFNEDNWRLLDGKYQTISVNISVDAATAETYQNLRGADFNHLMKNLTMLGDLHRRKKIQKFCLNFVVQRDNFREMPAFVELGKSLGVDSVNFQRLINPGAFTPQGYLERCLIIDNQYLDYELWCVLQDPIFKDPIVDLRGFQRYLDASERRYRQRYEKEQKQ